MKFLSVLRILIVLPLFFMGPSLKVHAEEQEIDIVTSPDKALFNVVNMKPGDWANRTLTIQNRGKKDFTYNTIAKFKGGSEKLYNEFLIEVWDSKGMLHQDKLSKFTGLNPRFLKTNHQEDLMFRIEMPYELGNEFQGLAFEFELRFVAEERTPGPNPDPNPDPNPNPNPDPNPNPNPNPDPNPNPEPEPEDPEDPTDPVDSDNPEDPENPTDPEKPGDTEEESPTDDEDTIKPQRPISEEDLKSDPVDGQILPDTATNMYNSFVGGAALVIVGLLIYFFQRRRKLIDRKIK